MSHMQRDRRLLVLQVTKPTDGGRIAMIHAGSDLFLRACYAPAMRAPHPVSVHTADGGAKQVSEDAPLMLHDVAGPLCFAGDVVVPAVELPMLEVGGNGADSEACMVSNV